MSTRARSRTKQDDLDEEARLQQSLRLIDHLQFPALFRKAAFVFISKYQTEMLGIGNADSDGSHDISREEWGGYWKQFIQEDIAGMVFDLIDRENPEREVEGLTVATIQLTTRRAKREAKGFKWREFAEEVQEATHIDLNAGFKDLNAVEIHEEKSTVPDATDFYSEDETDEPNLGDALAVHWFFTHLSWRELAAENGDLIIADREEFVIYFSKKHVAHLDSKLVKAIFDSIDVRGRGGVYPNEYFRWRNQVTPQDIADIMEATTGSLQLDGSTSQLGSFVKSSGKFVSKAVMKTTIVTTVKTVTSSVVESG